jgi:hypothetical protein
MRESEFSAHELHGHGLCLSRESHSKKNQPTSEIAPRHTSAFHSHTRPRPAHPSGASRAHQHLSSLLVLTRAQRTRVNFCPKHWLMCHLDVY